MTSAGRIVVALSLLAALWPNPAVAQKAGVVTTLEGNVTAARAAAAQPVALNFKDDVFVNDRVVTGDRSLARLLLGGKAVVTVRERSALTITEVPGRSTIDLDSGKIAVAVAKDKMRPGEQIEVKTPNAVAAVRGTVFVVEVIRASASAGNAQTGVTVNHYVFAGQIALNVGAQVLNVAANNFASVTGGVVNSGIMNAAMRANASGGLAPRGGLPKVSGAEGDAKQNAMSSTVATFNAGTGLPIIPPPPPPPPTIQLPQVQDVLLPGGGKAIPAPAPPPPPIVSAVVSAPGSIVTPDSILRPPPLCCLVPDSRVTDQYKSVGLLFGPTPAGIFNDGGGTAAWAGVNRNNVLDLISPVEVSFVMPGTNKPATTKHLSVEVGIAAVGSILLEAFGAGGVLLGSTANDDGIGPHGRTLATLNLDGISSLRVSGNDTWGIDQIEYGELIDPPDVLTLQRPLLRSTHEQRQAFWTFFDITDDRIVGESTVPLIWLTGSTFTTAHQFALLSNSDVTTAGSFLRLDDGSRIVQTNAGEPLVWMRGGSLNVGTGSSGGNLFDLIGRAGATQIDPETGLTLGTDRPIQPGAEAPVFQADRAAVVNVRGSAYKIDTALLEATAPLLNLKDGTIFTTGDNAIDLVGKAKVSIPNDAIAMVTISKSIVTVINGHFVNVAGGSELNVPILVSLADGAHLVIKNGALLNVSGGSSATIGRSIFSFTGIGNVVNVTNSIAPTALINGIPVAGPLDSFRIGANAL
ncbi:MAG TPA: FecR family protein, partial [Candidatus Binatia bacterium]|nr:FecR family protein [Candidatus Binatia bacterium]